MFIPPLMTLLGGGPEAFHAATKAMNTDWHQAAGPAAIYVSSLDKTIVTWFSVGTAGYKNCHVAAYDHATRTWSERYVVGNFLLADDDHGTTAIVRDSDGFLWVFYGSHASPQCWSVSTAADDISSWTQQADLTSDQTYPHPVLVGSTIYLFLRNDVVLSRRPLALRTGTPSSGSVTFSGMTSVVDLGADSRIYQSEAYAVGTDIHFACTRPNAADTARRHVYYFVYKTTTGAVENHDGSVSVASGSLPVDLATANASFRLFDHGSGQGEVPSLCFDSSGDPHIVFADNGGSGSNYLLKHIKRTAGVWSSPATVDTIFDAPAAGSSGFTTLYSITPAASGAVEAWFVDNDGNKLRKTRDSGGTWGPTQKICQASPNSLMSQQSVRFADSELRNVFCETAPGTGDANAVLSKRFAYGDNGPIDVAIDRASLDPHYPSVQVLLGFEHRDAAAQIVNDADSGWRGSPNGNAQADTAQKKFGNASLLLDGTGDFIQYVHSSVFSVANGDFTVDCWIKRNASKLHCIASKYPSSGSSEWRCFCNASNLLQLQAFTTSALILDITGVTSIDTDWHHVEFSRGGATWRCFLDGTLEASGTESSTPSSNTQQFTIGRDRSNTGRDFNGWIDEFRFTAGVCRHTASFTPPSAAHPRR